MITVVVYYLLYCICLETHTVAADSCKCKDISVHNGFPCSYYKFMQRCDEDWMIQGNYCRNTCEQCTCAQKNTPKSPATTTTKTSYNTTDENSYPDYDNSDMNSESNPLQFNIWQIILGVFWLWGILFWIYIQFRICRYEMSSYQRFGVGCLAIFYIPFLVLAPMEFFFRGTPLSVPFALIWIAFSSYHYYFFSMWFIRVRIVQQGGGDEQDTIIHVRGDFAIQIISEQQAINEAERRRQALEDANRIILTLPTANLEEREKQGSCSICLEELSDEVEEDGFVVLGCKHVFHSSCIKTWIQTQGRRANCPLCGNAIWGEQNVPLLA